VSTHIPPPDADRLPPSDGADDERRKRLVAQVTIELIRQCVAAEVVAIRPSRKGKVRGAFYAMRRRPGSH
jgi:hypothetical protein